MVVSPGIRAVGRVRRLRRSDSGGSLVEFALIIPCFLVLMCYAVNYGYFCIVTASIQAAAHDGCQYSGAGFTAPGQASTPAAGPLSSSSSVAGEILAGLTEYPNISTNTTVEVCSASNGVSSNKAGCTSYGAAGTTYAPASDPEAPFFVLQRVDVTYTVAPPISINSTGEILGLAMFSPLTIHRSVSMRAAN